MKENKVSNVKFGISLFFLFCGIALSLWTLVRHEFDDVIDYLSLFLWLALLINILYAKKKKKLE